MMFNQKILVLGNETNNTDEMTSELAVKDNTNNYGLIADADQAITNFGYYHTSISDIDPADILGLSRKFDYVILLDQPKTSYPHHKSFLTTAKLAVELEQQGVNVIYRDNKNVKEFFYWRKTLKENKSFCVYPFIAMVDNTNSATTCSKSYKEVTKVANIVDWSTDPDFLKVRKKMAAGEKLVGGYCDDCYNAEAEGIESARQFESLEWAERLGMKSIDDFFKVKSPVLYEFRPSNMCNIMCRTCDDGHSHLIEKEFKTIGIPLVDWRFVDSMPFDKVDFNVIERAYWAGGEPTIMPEFYDFLEKCISIGRTDFELNIGTNGMKFSNKLVNLLDHFDKVLFSFSYDGYKEVNDYIRWKSKFDVMVENGRMLRDHGHMIGLQTVFSMWSITRIHEIFEFYDAEYPKSSVLLQPARFPDKDYLFMPYNHPRPELVIESMYRCQKTKVYQQNGRSTQSMVDNLISYYSDPDYKVNVKQLKEFYEFNDLLDKSRDTKLGDYIPELEEGRKLCQ